MTSKYVVLVHAGAGYHSRKKKPQYTDLCKQACQAAIEYLRSNADPVQAATEAISVLENDPLTNAGFGSNLNIDGNIEMDASIMTDDGLFGSVGSISLIKNPIRVAQIVHDEQKRPPTDGRIPPCCLSGPGAVKFARDRGVEILPDQSSLIAERCEKNYSKYLNIISAHKRKQEGTTDSDVGAKRFKTETSTETDDTENGDGDDIELNVKLDTVGVIIISSDQLVTACSSGGVAMKHSGRISQVCMPGAGLWVNERTAVSTSGTGELIMKTCIAKSICDNLLTCNNEQSTCEILAQTMQQQFIESRAVQQYSKKALGVLALHKLDHQSVVAVIGFSTDSFAVGYQTSEMNEPDCQIYRNSVANNVNVTGIKLNVNLTQNGVDIT